MKVTKLFIVHASRQRAVQGVNAAINMVSSMVTGLPFTYVFSLDTDDPELNQYYEELKRVTFPYQVVVGSNRGSVDATNRGAVLVADEELMFVNGDDLISPPAWDEKLLRFVETIDVDKFLVHLPDGIPNSAQCAILQCISTALYRHMGYFFFPAYISMYADNDIFGIAKAMGVVRVYQGEPIKFIHDHPTFKGLPMDATYIRTNRPEAQSVGLSLFLQRQTENFGVHQ